MDINENIPNNESQDISSRREELINVDDVENSKLQQQQSTQENMQDLDQQQQVDVKPSQVSFQHLDVTINNKIENYSGRITGTTYTEENTLASNVEITLYFGSIGGLPVLQLSSNNNGNFVIEDLPPGYYSLKALHNKIYSDIIPNIKILPAENANQTIYLKKTLNHNAPSHPSRLKRFFMKLIGVQIEQ